MNKIYQYELRRILRSKFFWGLLAVCLFFGWNILQTSTIKGVAHTAPVLSMELRGIYGADSTSSGSGAAVFSMEPVQ